jgi:DNA-binding NtrC family response regulator
MPKDFVLCVDDEPVVLRACCIALSHAGFRTLVAENGAAGLDVYLEFKDEIALVLADIVMPAVNGIDMADSIRQVDPQAKILLMSSYSDHVLERQGRQTFPFIRKPFINLSLIERVRSVLGISDAAAAQS